MFPIEFSDFDVFMRGYGWGIFSLIAAIFSGGYYLVNQYMRQPGYALAFWMRVAIVIAMTPFMPFIPFPTDPRFYGAVALTALLGTGADVRTFNVSAEFGGGVVSRVMPLIVWGAFFLWLAIHPVHIREYMAHPWNTAGILLAMSGCVYFARRLNRCEITRAAFTKMLPALLAYIATTILNKESMTLGRTAGTYAGAVYCYMYLQSALSATGLGVYMVVRQRKKAKGTRAEWNSGRMALAVLLAGIFWICHMIYKNYGMAFTPNPSYLTAISLTAPVFIWIFYRLIGHREESDVMSGMGVVACAVLLALLTVH